MQIPLIFGNFFYSIRTSRDNIVTEFMCVPMSYLCTSTSRVQVQSELKLSICSVSSFTERFIKLQSRFGGNKTLKSFLKGSIRLNLIAIWGCWLLRVKLSNMIWEELGSELSWNKNDTNVVVFAPSFYSPHFSFSFSFPLYAARFRRNELKMFRFHIVILRAIILSDKNRNDTDR